MFWIIYLAFIGLVIVSLWKVFEKAGQPGWASIVPIYNVIVLLKIAGRPIWWIIIFPIAGLIVPFDIARKFGKGGGFGLGLLLLGFIFYPLLAFGDATYNPNA
ncbi:MAG TPA: signal peptidase I [Acidobacteria bacterium]|nr:signal peptidase I [Acidobacteriota bacterium]